MTLVSDNADDYFLSRKQLLNKMKGNHFDVLVIGGGATGAGAALDAATRGLKTVLVEGSDFSSGTSSRSTKLIHGGVRYLENAVKRCDKQEYVLVREALHERLRFLNNAPHLTRALPILTPVYRWFDAGYYLMGLKLYGMIAGKTSLGPSKFLSKKEALKCFPIIKQKGLKGAVLYYDGQFDDARMNLTLILTALREGAVASNYISVVSLIKDDGKIIGANVIDHFSKEVFSIFATIVINATGIFSDSVRKMDDPNVVDIIVPSQGSHIVLQKEFSSEHHGLIIPKTKDGRVVFLLPWQSKTIAGTTDQEEGITPFPRASNEEVEYILEHIQPYFDVPIKRHDVIATFSGLRPLAKPKSNLPSTASMSRDHVIDISSSNLITILGGKWTTYRKMAEDVIDTAIVTGKLKSKNQSLTKDLKLVGARFYDDKLLGGLISDEKIPEDVARNLVRSYGDRAKVVINIDNKKRLLRIIDGYPYIDAEIIYCIRYEYAVHVTDVIARRLRIAFLDNQAARYAVKKVAALMATTLGWDEPRINLELEQAARFLDTMLTVQ